MVSLLKAYPIGSGGLRAIAQRIRRGHPLVPKLCLGTQVAKLRFATPPRIGWASCLSGKQSFPTGVPKQSLGTRRKNPARPVGLVMRG
jgi:hypothetical protein